MRSVVSSNLSFPATVHAEAPVVVYWEATQACDLACRHCRAEAIPEPPPGELTSEEAHALLREIAAFRRSMLVITGGDPMKRPDLVDLVAEATGLGLRVALTPSGTNRLTPAAIEAMRAAGLDAIALSFDGSSATRHDAFRRVPGCFDRTRAAAMWVRNAGLPLQVNTTVTAETAGDLPVVHDLVAALGGARWSLFFLVPVGRGRLLQEVSPTASEHLCRWLFQRSRSAPFDVKTTEAPHYRRVVVEQLRRMGMSDRDIQGASFARSFGVRDGNGVVFVSSTGEIYPSGFLPLSAGNVRRDRLVDVYRESPLLRGLRDIGKLTGKCGRCPYRGICGGSRARAWARTGDPFASDPLCPYVPSEAS